MTHHTRGEAVELLRRRGVGPVCDTALESGSNVKEVGEKRLRATQLPRICR